jgi:hypothetical protein
MKQFKLLWFRLSSPARLSDHRFLTTAPESPVAAEEFNQGSPHP